MRRRIVLTGGGTGGHVTPNMALIPYLEKAGFDISYIGSVDGMEKGLIEPLGIPYYGIDSERLNRYMTLSNLTIPYHVLRGVHQARSILKKLKPDVVFSKGGFVSVPVVVAAHELRIPVVCHESDITPGLANKLATPMADRVCVNFEEALQYVKKGKGVYTGTPIRDSLLAGSREEGLAISGFSGDRPILLVMGGSSGAVGLNEGVRKALDRIVERFDVIHLCGRGNRNEELCGRDRYYQIEYANEEMPHFYAAADVVMSRAGANSLAELARLRLPNVLVPLPLDASRGDQILNARSFTEKGYSVTLEQSQMTPDTVMAALTEVWERREQYAEAMRSSPAGNGNEQVLKVIEDVIAARK